MRKLFFALSLLILISACIDIPSSEVTLDEIAFDEGFVPDLDIPVHGGERTIDFIAPEKWNVEISQTKAVSWCSAHPVSGNPGSASFTLYLEANDTGKDRKTEIRIISGPHQKTLVVEQSGEDQTSNFVLFDDSSFESAMKDVMGKQEITYEDLADISSLDISGYGIRSMTDLRYFTSLNSLICPGNEIRDIILSYPGLSNLKTLVAAPNDYLERIWVFNETDVINGISIEKSDTVRYALLASDNHFKVPLKGGQFDLYLRQGLSVINSKEDYSWLRFECVSQIDEYRLSKWRLTIDETQRSEIAEFYIEDETKHEGAVTEIIQVYTANSFWYPYSTTLLSDEGGLVKVADRKEHEEFEKKLLLEVSSSHYMVNKHHSADITLQILLKDPETSLTYEPDSVFINKKSYPISPSYSFYEESVVKNLEYDVVVVRNGTYYNKTIVIQANNNVSDDEYELKVTYAPTSVSMGSMVDVLLNICLYKKGTDKKVAPDQIFINGKEYGFEEEYLFNEGHVENELVYDIKVKKSGKEYLYKVVIPLNNEQGQEYELRVEYTPEEVYLDKKAQVVIYTWLVEINSGGSVTPDKVYINGEEYDSSGKYVFDVKNVNEDLTYRIMLIYNGKEYANIVNIPARKNSGGSTEDDEENKTYSMTVDYSPDVVTIGQPAKVHFDVILIEYPGGQSVIPDHVYVNGKNYGGNTNIVVNVEEVKDDLSFEVVVLKGRFRDVRNIVIPAQEDMREYRIEIGYSPKDITEGKNALVEMEVSLYDIITGMKVKPDRVYINDYSVGTGGYYSWQVQNVRENLQYTVEVHKGDWKGSALVTIYVTETEHSIQFYGPSAPVIYFDPQIDVLNIQLGVLYDDQDVNWKLSTTSDWIYFNSRTGRGIRDVQMIVNGSEYQSERQAKFRLEALDEYDEVLDYYEWTIIQEGINLSVITESNVREFEDFSDQEFDIPTFFFTPYPSSVNVDVQTNVPGLRYQIINVEHPDYDATETPLLQLESREELPQSYIYHTNISYPSNRVIDGSFPGKFRSSQIIMLPTNYVIDDWETLQYSEHYIKNDQNEYYTVEIQTYQLPIILTGLDYWYVAQAYSDIAGDFPNKVKGYDEDFNISGNAVTIVNNVSAELIYDEFNLAGFNGWTTSSPRMMEADGYTMNFMELDISLANRKRRAQVDDEYLGPIYRSYSTYSSDRVADLRAVLYAEVDMKDGEKPLIVPVTEVYQLGVPYFKADISWLKNERLSGKLNFKIHLEAEFECVVDALTYYLYYDHAEFGVFSGFNDSIGSPSWNRISEENGKWLDYKFYRNYTASEDALRWDTFSVVNDARIVFRDGTYLYCSEQMEDTYLVDVEEDEYKSKAKNIRPYNCVEAIPELTSPADVMSKKTLHRKPYYKQILHKSPRKIIKDSELTKLPGFSTTRD